MQPPRPPLVLSPDQLHQPSLSSDSHLSPPKVFVYTAGRVNMVKLSLYHVASLLKLSELH